jgi:signal peptidase I
VPPHAFFLLGDNRGESVDSRYHGFVADSAIVERPVMLFFSRDPATGHVRWTRIGWAIGSSEPSASAAGPG